MAGQLIIGFDAAWTRSNSGALVGVLRFADGSIQELGLPQVADYDEAEQIIIDWRAGYDPDQTIVFLDQPTIVENDRGQRPVENIVSSPVSLRYGGMQPANTGKTEMFGDDAPVWRFLSKFGGPADPMNPVGQTQVIETYPVLTMISLGWTLPDSRPSGRLPKYNPERRNTFALSDWTYVCTRVSESLRQFSVPNLSDWVKTAGDNQTPGKRDQDRLDACICLISALHLAESNNCLMVGDLESGHIVVPYDDKLGFELADRCVKTNRTPSDWIHRFRRQPRPIDRIRSR